MRILFVLSIFLFLLVFVGPVFSHSGGTNSDGCHTNRKTGDYHCHNSKVGCAGRDDYCHVIEEEERCGYALSTCNDLVREFGGLCLPED